MKHQPAFGCVGVDPFSERDKADTVADLATRRDAIDREIDKLVDRLIDVDVQSVAKRLEKRVSELEREKLVLSEKIEAGPSTSHTMEESFELAIRFLTSPYNIWEKGSVLVKKTVLRLAFCEPVEYCRNRGIRTPKIAFPFKVIGALAGGNLEMAHRGGFEPPTPRFVVWCSIQLSYRC